MKLYYITDRLALAPAQLPLLVESAIRAEVDLIQFREKDLTAHALIELVKPALENVRPRASRILVNDRLDVALALGAAGVHLGTQSLPPRTVRAQTPAGFLVGVSCHSPEEALEAEAAGADYALLGPIFETPSKVRYGPPLGLAKLREATARTRLPIFALGGVTVGRAKACLEASACGIAGISIFQQAPSLAERVLELRAL